MRRRGKIVVGAFWINLLLLLLFLAGLWGIGLVRFVGDIPDQVEDTTTKTDAIVVLTGGSGRVNEGLALLDKDLAAKLFVSGVYRGLDVRKLLQLARRNPSDLEARIGIGVFEDALSQLLLDARARLCVARLVAPHAEDHLSRTHAHAQKRTQAGQAARCAGARAAPMSMRAWTR